MHPSERQQREGAMSARAIRQPLRLVSAYEPLHDWQPARRDRVTSVDTPTVALEPDFERCEPANLTLSMPACRWLATNCAWLRSTAPGAMRS